jgi:CRISPR-associated endoribonuclease Cas6
MRLKIVLKTHANQYLDFNYQQYLSAAIYEKINLVNWQVGKDLHEVGFKHDRRGRFTNKSFCFSVLFDLKKSFNKGDFFMKVAPCYPYFYISIHKDEISEMFVGGIFKNESFNIGNFYASVHEVKVVKECEMSEEMKFRAISPICVRRRWLNDGEGWKKDIRPTEEGYAQNIMENLITKYETYNKRRENYGQYDFNILKVYNSVLVKMNKSMQKGYFVDFEIKCMPDLIEMGFVCGFGGLNSQGFGLVDVINNN